MFSVADDIFVDSEVALARICWFEDAHIVVGFVCVDYECLQCTVYFFKKI